MNRAGKFFVWLFRTIFQPYRCKRCGEPYRKVFTRELPPDLRQLHVRGGTAWDIDEYAYRCDRCMPPDEVVLIS